MIVYYVQDTWQSGNVTAGKDYHNKRYEWLSSKGEWTTDAERACSPEFKFNSIRHAIRTLRKFSPKLREKCKTRTGKDFVEC